jgi:hypothetical protein
VASNSITKIHPYGVPLCWWLVDAQEQHRPYNPYCALRLFINGIVNVFLANFVVCCRIALIEVIELDPESEDQEHLAKPRDADPGRLFVHEGQLGLDFLAVTDIEDGVLVVEKHI